MWIHGELGCFEGRSCWMESCGSLNAISFPKCQTFQILSRQQTHSCVGISSFTDTACPWFSALIDVLLRLPKNTALKHSFWIKKQKYNNFQSQLDSGIIWFWGHVCIILCYWTICHKRVLPFVQTNQSALQVQSRGPRDSGLSYLWTNKLQCWLITGLECEKRLTLNSVCC